MGGPFEPRILGTSHGKCCGGLESCSLVPPQASSLSSWAQGAKLKSRSRPAGRPLHVLQQLQGSELAFVHKLSLGFQSDSFMIASFFLAADLDCCTLPLQIALACQQTVFCILLLALISGKLQLNAALYRGWRSLLCIVLSVLCLTLQVLQLLGKLGGRNRRFLKEPLHLECKENPELGLRFILTFQPEPKFLVPLDKCIALAKKGLFSMAGNGSGEVSDVIGLNRLFGSQTLADQTSLKLFFSQLSLFLHLADHPM